MRISGSALTLKFKEAWMIGAESRTSGRQTGKLLTLKLSTPCDGRLARRLALPFGCRNLSLPSYDLVTHVETSPALLVRSTRLCLTASGRFDLSSPAQMPTLLNLFLQQPPNAEPYRQRSRFPARRDHE
jgi:hypothetical protein